MTHKPADAGEEFRRARETKDYRFWMGFTFIAGFIFPLLWIKTALLALRDGWRQNQL